MMLYEAWQVIWRWGNFCPRVKTIKFWSCHASLSIKTRQGCNPARVGAKDKLSQPKCLNSCSWGWQSGCAVSLPRHTTFLKPNDNTDQHSKKYFPQHYASEPHLSPLKSFILELSSFLYTRQKHQWLNRMLLLRHLFCTQIFIPGKLHTMPYSLDELRPRSQRTQTHKCARTRPCKDICL